MYIVDKLRWLHGFVVGI